MRLDPLFGLSVPLAVEGVDPALLDPRRTWADPLAYDASAQKLLALFEQNFRKFGDFAAGLQAAE
jgi:phosphoenolpyruvate carboxykinase (ATP)